MEFLSHPLVLALVAGGVVAVFIKAFVDKRTRRSVAERDADIATLRGFQDKVSHDLVRTLAVLDAWSGFPREVFTALEHVCDSYDPKFLIFHNGLMNAQAGTALQAAKNFSYEASRLCIDVNGAFRTRPSNYFEDQVERFEREAREVEKLAHHVSEEFAKLYALGKAQLAI